MKNYKAYSIILLFLLAAYAAIGSADTELTDRVDKTFKVNASTLLTVKNSFGKIEINNWERDEIHVVVDIIVEGNNESRAEKLMDAIEVTYRESGSEVFFQTKIDNMNNRGGESFEVNYTIKMPISNPIDIKNSFGDIYLNDRQGSAVLDVSYGALKAENLLGDNEIEVSFGKGYFDRVERGEITIKYSDVEIASSDVLEMDTQFSKVELDEVNRLELEAKYGSVTLGNVGDLDADASFNGLNLETLAGSLILEASYVSNFEIDKVLPSFQLIDIKGKFSSFELNLDDDVSADLEATFEYSDLKDNGAVIDYSYRVRDNNENEYRGKINGGNSGKRILIDSSYGNCKIYQ
jgi:hypothetical protein